MNDESEHVPGGGHHYASFHLSHALFFLSLVSKLVALRLYVVNSCNVE